MIFVPLCARCRSWSAMACRRSAQKSFEPGSAENGFFGRQAFRNSGCRMHRQRLLVIGAVMDADAPALGQGARRAPEKIVVKLLG